MDSPLELRCFCSRQPLLGVCGRDKDGNAFVHVKIFKQARIFGEVIATDGLVRLRCRECLRWHAIRIRRENVDFKPQPLPESIEV